MRLLRNIAGFLPTFLTAFVLALVVWIIAVTGADPSVEKAYPSDVPIEIIGQSTDLVISSTIPDSVALTLRAPNSVWSSLINQKAPVRAILDLTGMGVGAHTVPIQIEIGVKPVEVVLYSPRSVEIKLEKLASSQFEIKAVTVGSVTIGYQVGTPEIDQTVATVSGASSLVSQVAEIRAQINVDGKTADFTQAIALKAYDEFGVEVKNVTISPEKVQVKQSITQLGGFKNVVVKVVTEGQVAMGYKLTSIQVNPPTVTVYSTDTALIDALPGYIETDPINLTGLKDDINQDVNLRLPDGVTVVGDPTVNVQVSITSVENSVQYNNVPIEAIGLQEGYTAEFSPSTVDIIVTGPMVSLNSIIVSDLRVQVDLSDFAPGTYTFEPKVITLNYPDLRIENILPSTFQVTIVGPTPTP